jgi:hypothetical protein
MPRQPNANSTTTAKGATVSSYFRAIFKENREMLKSRSNDEILDRWLADHPWEKEVPERVKVILAKVKSSLRHKRRNKMKKKEQAGGQAVYQEAGAAAVAQKLALADDRTLGLERLEGQIDECLTVARSLDEKKLSNAISLLRKARREVVWQLGE